MTTNHHTAITTGAAANASTINTPLGQLDAAIDAEVDAITSGLTAGRVVYVGAGPVLDDEAGFEYNDSTNTLTASKIAATTITASLFLTASVVLGDDAVTSFTPVQTSGILIVHPVFTSSAVCTTQSLIAAYRAGSSGYIGAIVLGSATTVTAGTALTGTTGTDGKLNVSCHTDGKVYIENRLGGALTVYYTVI